MPWFDSNQLPHLQMTKSRVPAIEKNPTGCWNPMFRSMGSGSRMVCSVIFVPHKVQFWFHLTRDFSHAELQIWRLLSTIAFFFHISMKYRSVEWIRIVLLTDSLNWAVSIFTFLCFLIVSLINVLLALPVNIGRWFCLCSVCSCLILFSLFGWLI